MGIMHNGVRFYVQYDNGMRYMHSATRLHAGYCNEKWIVQMLRHTHAMNRAII